MTVSKYSGLETFNSLESIQKAYNKENKLNLINGSLVERIVFDDSNISKTKLTDCIDKIIDAVLSCFSGTYQTAKTTARKNLSDFKVNVLDKPTKVVPSPVDPKNQTPSKPPMAKPIVAVDIKQLTEEIQKLLDEETKTETETKVEPQTIAKAKTPLKVRAKNIFRPKSKKAEQILKAKAAAQPKTVEQLEKELKTEEVAYEKSAIKMLQLMSLVNELLPALNPENPAHDKPEEVVALAQVKIMVLGESTNDSLKKVKELTTEILKIDPSYDLNDEKKITAVAEDTKNSTTNPEVESKPKAKKGFFSSKKKTKDETKTTPVAKDTKNATPVTEKTKTETPVAQSKPEPKKSRFNFSFRKKKTNLEKTAA